MALVIGYRIQWFVFCFPTAAEDCIVRYVPYFLDTAGTASSLSTQQFSPLLASVWTRAILAIHAKPRAALLALAFSAYLCFFVPIG